MPKYYPGLRDIHVLPVSGRVICLSDLGNILAYYLDKTTLISLLYKHKIKVEIKSTDLDEEDTDKLQFCFLKHN